MFLKICGITRLEDALHAAGQGATALGFVLWPRSPRYIAPASVARILAALPAPVDTVGVFVNESVDEIRRAMEQTGLSMVQLHGDEQVSHARQLAWPILRSVTLATVTTAGREWPAETTFLLDAADPERRGGTGQRLDWAKAAPFARKRRLVLAGGLTPENVAVAVSAVRPYGVDVSSGVEDAPGVKNATKVAEFCAAARKALSDSHLVMEK
jgi:phosphoribosylanthranilate isomerase